MRHLHLDPIGGAAGDMFVAALLHAFPEHEAAVIANAAALSDAPCRLLRHDDDILSGTRFEVRDGHPPDARRPEPQGGGEGEEHAHRYQVPAHDHGPHHTHGDDHGAHGHRWRDRTPSGHDGAAHGAGTGHHHAGGAREHGPGHRHAHTAWREIRARIADSALPEPVQRHATGIFALLAAAEAEVHGREPDDVTFHEVGAADSIADIVAAATLIAALEPASWSSAPLPLGSGRVRTAHGVMPVPAPATALLLRGFATLEDGVAGERVTPTGAAILRHLGCHETAQPPLQAAPRRLERTGIGFGTKRFPGLSNCLRVLAFAPEDAAVARGTAGHRTLSVIQFEVDDQSAEDLAAGLDRLRAAEGVHDVLQMAAFGKKGRMATHVQVLVRPDAAATTAEACFRETTTIGLRLHQVQGMALARTFSEVAVDGRRLRVKRVARPGGATCKAEADDVLSVAGHAARVRLRRHAEARALCADHTPTAEAVTPALVAAGAEE